MKDRSFLFKCTKVFFFCFFVLFCFVFNLISSLLKTITTSPWNPSVTHFVIFSPVIVTCHPETIVLKWYFCLFVFIIQDCLYWVSRNVFPLYVYSSTLCCAPLSGLLTKVSIDYFSVERWNSLLNFLNIKILIHTALGNISRITMWFTFSGLWTLNEAIKINIKLSIGWALWKRNCHFYYRTWDYNKFFICLFVCFCLFFVFVCMIVLFVCFVFKGTDF